MDIKTALLLITAGINLGFATFIVFKYRAQEYGVYFSLVLFCIALWSLSIGIFRETSELPWLFFWLKLYYVASGLIVTFFYFFTYYFPNAANALTATRRAVIMGAAMVMVLMATIGPVSSISPISGGNHTVVINYLVYTIYSVFFLSLITLSFCQLLIKINRATSHAQYLLKVIFTSTFLAALFGTFFNLLLPLFTYEFIWIGPLFTMLMIFIILHELIFKNDRIQVA